MRQVLLCGLVAFALQGCFESTAPLIAPSEAVFPFGSGTHFTAYEWNHATREWDKADAGTLRREADHYVQIDEFDLYHGLKPFVLKSLGGGYYIAQQTNDAGYVYDLLRIDENTVYQYGLACTAADQALVARGLIQTFTTDTRASNSCTVSSFEKLAAAFRLIARNRPPEGKYLIER